MSTTAAAISATARLISPIVTDLYKAAKGKVQNDLAAWSGAASAKAIAKTLAKIESVKTLYSPDKELPIQKFYYPSQIRGDGKNQKIDSIDDLPEGNVTVQGIVGQGKSIFLRYLASTAIRSASHSRIPIFIELRTLSTRLPLKQSILRVLESIGVKSSEETLSYLAASGRLALLLDGFDEVTEDYVSELILDLDDFAMRYPNLRIIISSRPGNEIQKTTGFHIVELSGLEKSDHSPFLQRLGLDAAKRSDITRAIASSPGEISGVLRTPLMMTLLVMVYESEREIPSTLPEFFERLFQIVFSRHDRLKAGFNRKHHSGLSERKLQLLFEAFCFMALQAGFGRSLTREQFASAFDSALSYMDECKCEMEKFRLDITKVACLMLEEGIDLATFLHKSIPEYFAAAFIRHSSDEIADAFYDIALQHYRQWSDVLSFLRDIDPYRFAKQFSLKEIPPVLARVSGILERRSRSELLAFVEENQPGFSVVFVKDRGVFGLKKSAPLRAYIPASPPIGDCFSSLMTILINAMEATVPDSFSSEDVAAAVADLPHSRSVIGIGIGKNASLSYDAAIRLFDDSYFWMGLERFRKSLEDKLESARKIIEGQERRMAIFKRK